MLILILLSASIYWDILTLVYCIYRGLNNEIECTVTLCGENSRFSFRYHVCVAIIKVDLV